MYYELLDCKTNTLDRLQLIGYFFDSIYFLKSLGIIKDKNWIYKKFHNSQLGSTIWLITTILTTRKSFVLTKNLIKSRILIQLELKKVVLKKKKNINKIGLLNNSKHKTFNDLANNLKQKIKDCNRLLIYNFFEFLQNLVHILIATNNILNIKNLKEKINNFIAIEEDILFSSEKLEFMLKFLISFMKLVRVTIESYSIINLI